MSDDPLRTIWVILQRIILKSSLMSVSDGWMRSQQWTTCRESETAAGSCVTLFGIRLNMAIQEPSPFGPQPVPPGSELLKAIVGRCFFATLFIQHQLHDVDIESSPKLQTDFTHRADVLKSE